MHIKKGDTVRRITPSPNLTLGKTYIVKEIYSHEHFDLYVVNDKGVLDKYLKEHFENVEDCLYLD